MGRSLYLLGKHRGAIEASQHVNSLHQEFQRNIPEVYDEAQKMSPDDWEIWHNKGWMVSKMMLMWHKYTLRTILYQHVTFESTGEVLIQAYATCTFGNMTAPLIALPRRCFWSWQRKCRLHMFDFNSLRLNPCCHRRTRFNGMMWLSCSWERRGCVQAADLPLSCRVFPCRWGACLARGLQVGHWCLYGGPKSQQPQVRCAWW